MDQEEARGENKIILDLKKEEIELKPTFGWF